MHELKQKISNQNLFKVYVYSNLKLHLRLYFYNKDNKNGSLVKQKFSFFSFLEVLDDFIVKLVQLRSKIC